jgi:hypothetical protein
LIGIRSSPGDWRKIKDITEIARMIWIILIVMFIIMMVLMVKSFEKYIEGKTYYNDVPNNPEAGKGNVRDMDTQKVVWGKKILPNKKLEEGRLPVEPTSFDDTAK